MLLFYIFHTKYELTKYGYKCRKVYVFNKFISRLIKQKKSIELKIDSIQQSSIHTLILRRWEKDRDVRYLWTGIYLYVCSCQREYKGNLFILCLSGRGERGEGLGVDLDLDLCYFYVAGTNFSHSATGVLQFIVGSEPHR